MLSSEMVWWQSDT